MMNRVTLMLIASAALPVAAIAQPTTAPTPPTETVGNTTANDPATAPTDATTNTVAPALDATTNSTATEAMPVPKAHGKKKKPMNATEPRP
jgi:hypothetical protein